MRPLGACLLAAALSGCATGSAFHAGQQAERASDFDRAVVEYTKAVRANPDDRDARPALERAKHPGVAGSLLRAGAGSPAAERYEEALVEFELASELNPTDGDVDDALQGHAPAAAHARSPSRAKARPSSRR